MYTDSLKHKPMTGFPWLTVYGNHGFDPCSINLDDALPRNFPHKLKP